MTLEAPPATSPAVHNVMIANKSTNTKPELLVRRFLRNSGFPGYRLHWRIDGEDGHTSAGRILPSRGGSWRSLSMVASGIGVLRAILVSRNQMWTIGTRSLRRT